MFPNINSIVALCPKFGHRNLLWLFLIVTILFSCEIEEIGGSPDVVSTTQLDPNAKNIFDKLNNILKEAKRIYPAITFPSDYPAYVILNASTAGIPQGYLLNPETALRSGSVTFEGTESYIFDLYGNDDYIDQALNELTAGDKYSFDFGIGSQSSFLIHELPSDHFYDSYKNVDNNWLPLVYTHEMFHLHQINNWTYSPLDGISFEDFPMTLPELTTLLYMYELMYEAYTVDDPLLAENYLKRFVVLREKQIEDDTSGQNVVERMTNFEELIEGSARYLEVFSAEFTIYQSIKDDPTQGWRDFINGDPSPAALQNALAFRTWYHTGAAVCYLLDQLDVPLESNFRTGKSPFAVARDYLNLTVEEKDQLRQAIVNSYAWESYEERASEILLLLAGA